jgi:iron-sulfur cluster repair protein YtfE (RIC family)
VDICKVILDDHERILALVDELEDLDPANPEAIRQSSAQLSLMLESHVQAEEQLVYPLLQQDPEGRDLMLLAMEEHHVVTVLLHELLGLSPADEHFIPKCDVLVANLEEHIEAEEEELLPLLLDLIDEPHAQDLGRRFQHHLAVLRHPEQRAA